ncbi:hypothetical protein MS3_00005679 [Schistosoma haematobium]|uniref:Uncharacterized protein n=2 Tax=Schistosoma haematobium TaxID=6185 RepID=A0A094ZNF3_SCHHA|nr:hypothetical protein MS3_00005679 [Schistosoma haematobium]KAH9588210.1 hypothetical protein MS3_00005679 [Schistosoma haematobium]CAH8561159.1 unnamed protein product [Schistosoma haematobium]CAH8565614.1 unnamed protein product [Schistosoma haematobium]
MEEKSNSSVFVASLSKDVKSWKYRNNHSKFITSTPINCQNHRNISSVKQESRISFSINERLTNLLNKILPLKKKWSTNFHQSCIVFTNLASNICKILSGSSSFENHDDFVTYGLCNLYLNDNLEQMTKLRDGQILETYYDKLNECIKNMEDCGVQLKSMLDQLNALRNLSQNESIYQQYATCQSTLDSSVKIKSGSTLDGNSLSTLNSTRSRPSTSLKQQTQQRNLSGTYLYEVLNIEINGLINQIERDSSIRKYLVKIILPSTSHYFRVNTTVQDNFNVVLLKFVSIWRHFGQYVSWFAVISMSEHILKTLKNTD